MTTNASQIEAQAQLYKRPRIHFPSDQQVAASSDKACNHDRQAVTIREHQHRDPNSHTPSRFWADDGHSPKGRLMWADAHYLRLTNVTHAAPYRIQRTFHQAPPALRNPARISTLHLEHYAAEQNELRRRLDASSWHVIRVELCDDKHRPVLVWESDLAPLYEEEAATYAEDQAALRKQAQSCTQV